jgi:alanine-glyoxylate transaminase / serine-glyoxylate transaminase / serine-pyruvate transaminase
MSSHSYPEQVVLDGVCSVASEEIRFDDWDIDVVLSATQKGLGTPPGLSVLVASPRAIKVYYDRLFTFLLLEACSVRFSRIAQSQSLRTMPAGASMYNFTHCIALHLLINVYIFASSQQTRWLPIMQAYEAGKAAYFATPPVNLIYAFHASLKQIVEGTPSLQDRFRLHREASQRVKKAVEELGLKQVSILD